MYPSLLFASGPHHIDMVDKLLLDILERMKEWETSNHAEKTFMQQNTKQQQQRQVQVQSGAAPNPNKRCPLCILIIFIYFHHQHSNPLSYSFTRIYQ